MTHRSRRDCGGSTTPGWSSFAPCFGSFIADPDEVEARSTLAFALAIGRHFIAADHPGRTKREAIHMAGELLLRPQP